MILLTSLVLLLLGGSPTTVSVSVSSSVAEQGQFHLAVYDSQQGFKHDTNVLQVTRDTDGSPRDFLLELPTGHYAIAVFHDLNGNGKLDTNFLGIPTEPYGFGQAPPTKWRPPVFREIATLVERDTREIVIELKRWQEQ